jgi:hypothetical protein
VPHRRPRPEERRDCAASRRMGRDMIADVTLRSRGTNVRVVGNEPPSKTTEGAGKAGCPPHPWSACNKKHAAGPQVQADHPAFPAQWFYGLYVLSSVTIAWLPPSFAGLIETSELSACVGAPGPHDFAVRTNELRSAMCVHRIPFPTSVTIASRPSFRKRDERKKATDLGVRSIATDRDTLARRANCADQACVLRHITARHSGAARRAELRIHFTAVCMDEWIPGSPQSRSSGRAFARTRWRRPGMTSRMA